MAEAADLRWTRESRVRKRIDFVRVQSAPAARLVSRWFVLLLSPAPPLSGSPPAPPRPEAPSESQAERASASAQAPHREVDGARFGIVASKKVGGAVRRNRAKRLLREALRRRKALFGSKIDVVVVALAPLVGARLADVVAELDRLAPVIERRVRTISR